MVKNLEASFSGSSQLFVIVIVVGYVSSTKKSSKKPRIYLRGPTQEYSNIASSPELTALQ